MEYPGVRDCGHRRFLLRGNHTVVTANWALSGESAQACSALVGGLRLARHARKSVLVDDLVHAG
jgi:hypothetical protein